MKLFVSALIASKSASSQQLSDIGACLQDWTAPGCAAVDVAAEFDANGVGMLESPHPYKNNMVYRFTIAGSGVMEFTFPEFEVDILDDGSCGDEVWISRGQEAALGPFCGFDEAFANPDSLNYDYYYDSLLNTMPEALKGSLFVKDEITILLVSKSLVNNWGFKVTYKQVDCLPGYVFDSDLNECVATFEDIGAYPQNLVCPGPDCGSMLRVANGAVANRDAWAFMARMVDGERQCNGVILDDETVLTAADCCVNFPEVHVGNFNSNVAEAGEFAANVVSATVHPNADVNLCVVKVEDMSVEGAPVQVYSTACLPDNPLMPGRACWTAGWGSTVANQNPSAKLREAGLNIFDRDYCVAKSKPSAFRSFALGQGEFCAGMPDKNDDGLTDSGPSPCDNDQGAPLICDDAGAPVMYGAFSRQTGCAKVGQPSIFTDIFANKAWIKSLMAEPCPTEPPMEVTFGSLEDEHLPDGLVCENSASRINDGVVPGDELARWKFLANIQRNNEPGKVQCGGTVVNGCHVITAASCCWNFELGEPRPASQFKVGFADYDVRDNKFSVGEFAADVFDLFVHPDFDPETKLHDLCIMQFYPLADQTAESDVIAPACLPAAHDVDMATCWTAGWGENKAGDAVPAPLNTARETALNVFPHDYCVAKTDNVLFKYDQFCAGVPDQNDDGMADSGNGLCHFDEGNPLICPVNGQPVLYGVTSQVSCGKRNDATIFAKTAGSWNSPWIAEIIGQECPASDGQCLYPASTGVPVKWAGGKQSKILYKTDDAVMTRITLPQYLFDFNIRETPYLIFAIFQRRYCGQGFFDAFNDEEMLYKEVMDSDDNYELQYTKTRIDDRYSSLTMQIRMHTVRDEDLPFWKGAKVVKKDQLFFLVGGLENVDWRGKDRQLCFEKMVVGGMAMPSDVGDPQGNFDYTPCVSEEKLVGF